MQRDGLVQAVVADISHHPVYLKDLALFFFAAEITSCLPAGCKEKST
jgi:hypothetical protein